MSSDLAALPRVRFVDGDAADVERNVIAGYERLSAGRSRRAIRSDCFWRASRR